MQAQNTNTEPTRQDLLDAWAAYDATARGVVLDETQTASLPSDVDTAISYAALRVLQHRYATAIGGAMSLDCYQEFMGVLGLDPDDETAVGNTPAVSAVTETSVVCGWSAILATTSSRCPPANCTTLRYGASDRRAMPGGPWLAERIPQADLVVVPGATHLATLLGSWPALLDALLG